MVQRLRLATGVAVAAMLVLTYQPATSASAATTPLPAAAQSLPTLDRRPYPPAYLTDRVLGARTQRALEQATLRILCSGSGMYPKGPEYRLPTVGRSAARSWATRMVQSLVDGYGGRRLVLDGRFGPRTRAAVIAWQRENNRYGRFGDVAVDGIVDDRDWYVLSTRCPGWD